MIYKQIKHLLVIFLLFNSIIIVSQSKEISFDSKLFVGKIKNGKPKLLINKKDFINAVNKEFYKNDPIIDNIEVIQKYTLGAKKIKYFYVEFSSSKRKDLHIVRWLCNYDDKLYFDKSNNPDIYTYVDLFIICEGDEKCRPRLFYMGENDLGWSCREFIGCVTEEEALVNKCTQGNAAF